MNQVQSKILKIKILRKKKEIEKNLSTKRKNPRRTNGNARNKLRERIKAQRRDCALCGNPIDYSLPAGHPGSYELDEIIPVSRGGSPYDVNNVQPVHRICNQKKGNRVISNVKEFKNMKHAPKNFENIQCSTDWLR